MRSNSVELNIDVFDLFEPTLTSRADNACKNHVGRENTHYTPHVPVQYHFYFVF